MAGIHCDGWQLPFTVFEQYVCDANGSGERSIMKPLSIALATLCTSACFAQSQPLVSYEAVYDTVTRKSIAVVTTPGPTFTDVLGTKQTLQFYYFAGTDTFGNPLAGVNLKFKYKLAKELDVVAGPAAILTQGDKWRGTVFFGFTYRQ